MFRSIIVLIFILHIFQIRTFPGTSPGELKNRVDWMNGHVSAFGVSEVHISPGGEPMDDQGQGYISINRARMIGYDRARDIALENLMAQLKDVSVEYDRALGEYIDSDETVRSRLSSLINSRIKTRNYPADFQKSCCHVQLKISDLLSIFSFQFPSEDFPEIYHNPIKTDYTGLIIDVRNMNIRPMLFPVIYNEDGLEIYGRNYVDISSASRHGIVSYVYNENDAAKIQRLGARPFFAPAIRNNNGSPVISNRDYKKIISSGRTLDNLKKCKVIFIVDRV